MSLRQHRFADLPPTPTEHFRLYFYATIGRMLEVLSQVFGSPDALVEAFPFLGGYAVELAGCGADRPPGGAASWWQQAIRTWEASVERHLPLRALREATGLDHDALTLLIAVGLVEEEARFGAFFEALHGRAGQQRPTLGLLGSWWGAAPNAAGLPTSLRRLQALGLVAPVGTDAPRAAWALRVPGPIWEALHGDASEWPAPGLHYRASESLPTLDDLILSDDLLARVRALPALLATGEAPTLVIRGPRRNGRRTLLRAVSRAIGRGCLEIEGPLAPDDERWRSIGILAIALNAMPCLTLDPGPGESIELDRPPEYDGPLGLVLGRQGGIGGAAVERAASLTLELPDPAARRRHWQRAFGDQPVSGLDTIGERFRLTSGNIQRAAGLARTYAALDSRAVVTPADVQSASRALNRQALETLARPVPAFGGWDDLAVSPETLDELRAFEARCRHRERLGGVLGQALASGMTSGVRALFSGPSGTGKTLAARVVASALGMDLYRVDLSAVVNKYIGETEKNLHRLFSCAEELDVILLLDEGDALMTGRTSVQTANDRYANLETNYLLQRLEELEGILIVTTNAAQHIDSAFQRRMDLVVTFEPPTPSERWTIWRLHLPPTHQVPSVILEEVSRRCELRGGQIRNAALHAGLLALDDGGTITATHLEAAVRREYRKLGTICPLRPAALAGVGR